MTDSSSPGSDTPGTSKQERTGDGRTQLASTASEANSQAVRVGSDIFRRVSVKGSGGVRATVEVVVRQGKVWLSIVPYFVGDAILDPEKVDQVIRVLVQARDDARRREHRRLPGWSKETDV